MNFPEFFQGLLVLIVIVLIFFLAWYIPNLIARKGTIAAKGRNIAVLEKIPVSKDSYIMLLKTFDKVIVVGVTPGGMTTLRELDGDSVEEESSVVSPQSFAEILRGAVSSTLPDGKIKSAFEKMTGKKKGGGSGEEQP